MFDVDRNADGRTDSRDPGARGSGAVSVGQSRSERRAPRANASSRISRNCARRSATSCIARSSIRSTRSCARSNASANTSATPSTRRSAIASSTPRIHKSHIDYLVEPLVLDDAGIRPPIIAAGINLFGGPLGLIHKHVTGAMPIRRNTKDPGVPDHAEGVRRRAAAQARPVLLSGGRHGATAAS